MNIVLGNLMKHQVQSLTKVAATPRQTSPGRKQQIKHSALKMPAAQSHPIGANLVTWSHPSVSIIKKRHQNLNLLLVEPLGQADIDSGETDPTSECPPLAPKRATVNKRLEEIHLCSNISEPAGIQLIRTNEPATGYLPSTFASTNSVTPTQASLRNRCAVELPIHWSSTQNPSPGTNVPRVRLTVLNLTLLGGPPGNR